MDEAPLPYALVPLGGGFYDRPTLIVAREAIGKWLVRIGPGGQTLCRADRRDGSVHAGRSAYHGWNALDAPTGLVRLTGRTHDLFGPPGRAYLYPVYERHWMLNLVTERAGVCGSVLVRALVPTLGLDEMMAQRPAARTVRALCNGPGNLTAALSLGKAQHGLDLTTDVPGPDSTGALFLADAEPDARWPIATSSRIGLTRGVELPWRFFVAGEPCVSKGVPSDLAQARRALRRPQT